MATVFRCANGQVAIWEGAQDSAPFSNPRGHMNRVKFHSDLDYVRVIRVINRTLTIPRIPSTGSGQSDAGSRVQSYGIGAHGQPGTPFIVGIINVGGQPMAFTGSVLVHTIPSPNSRTLGDSFGRFLALGADATNMYVHEYSVQAGNDETGLWDARPAQTFNLTLGITDILL